MVKQMLTNCGCWNIFTLLKLPKCLSEHRESILINHSTELNTQ